VAAHTVLKVGDAFLAVLAFDLDRLVFVTVIAGIG
jgi:hypothetical protein